MKLMMIPRKYECPRSRDIFCDYLLPEMFDLRGYTAESGLFEANTRQDPKKQFLES